MSEMVEKVARAICGASCGKEQRPECKYPNCECLGLVEKEARAAIEAMKEPSPYMIERGCEGVHAEAERDGFSNRTIVTASYSAMITAALESK